MVTLFGPDEPLTPEERRATRWITAVNQRRRPFTPQEGDHLVRLYDGNLAYVDREIGRLRRRLEDRGLLEQVDDRACHILGGQLPGLVVAWLGMAELGTDAAGQNRREFFPTIAESFTTTNES